MPRHAKEPRYFEARRALNRHLFRHHNGATSHGELSERLEHHGELHALGPRFGVVLDHEHAPATERDEMDLAFRLFKEGNEQAGRS